MSAAFSEALYILNRRKPAHVTWLQANEASNDFARSLLTRLREGAELTPKQAAALDRAVAGHQARAEAPAPDTKPEGVKVDVAPMVASLNAAHESGLKRPRLLTARFVFSRAPDKGRNPGAIYVTANSTADAYLGKIIDGQFLPGRDCDDAQRDAIVAVCADPMGAAKLYGQETGRCSCCGRELTDADSIAASIGPVCAERYGFAR